MLIPVLMESLRDSSWTEFESDLLAKMRSKVTHLTVRARDNRDAVERDLTIFKKVAGRFSVESGEENLLESVIQNQIRAAEEAYRQASEELAVFERAQQYLSRVKFRRDPGSSDTFSITQMVFQIT